MTAISINFRDGSLPTLGGCSGGCGSACAMSSATNDPLLEPEEHVLSTLERDGSRRWLRPRLSMGNLWKRRRIVAYLLMAVFRRDSPSADRR